MISKSAVGKAAKTSSLLMLFVVMAVVPLFVYSTVPRASAWFTATSSSAATTTFSGRAFDAALTLSPAPTQFFVDTGPLPPGGGTIDATVAPITLPFGSVDALVAVTMGFDSTAQSIASAGTLDIVLPISDSPRITADFVS